MPPSQKPSSIPLEDDPEHARARVEHRRAEKVALDEANLQEALERVMSSRKSLGLVKEAANLPRTSIEKPIPAPLTLAQFEELLQKEGLAEKLPELKKQLAGIAAYNRETFGFAFTPDELTIPASDIPRMLLGLREGILVRPLVIDSPTARDITRLKLKGEMTMHEYRVRQLAKSGINFYDLENRIAILKESRAPLDAPLYQALVDDDGAVDASREHIAAIYETLPPTETIASRAGSAPQLRFLGLDDEPSENRVLADGPDGEPIIDTRTSADRTATGALEARARFSSPEAALLALGLPGVRDGKTTKFTRKTYGWLGAVTADGSVVGLRASDDVVSVGAADPSYQFGDFRVPASA